MPEEVRAEVVKRVYADAARIGWATLSQAEKGRWYDRWAGDPDVGGRLLGYIRDDRVRVWLKDGPLKAYAHATAGVGPYAKYAEEEGATPEKAVRAALGAGWEILPETIETKPLRVAALSTESQEQRLVVYGTSRGFKELIWSALVSVTNQDVRVTILVLENLGAVSHPERAWQEGIAARCGVTVTWGCV